ncbi:hypothetical protein [Streptomyces noursei]
MAVFVHARLDLVEGGTPPSAVMAAAWCVETEGRMAVGAKSAEADGADRFERGGDFAVVKGE